MKGFEMTRIRKPLKEGENIPLEVPVPQRRENPVPSPEPRKEPAREPKKVPSKTSVK